MSTGAPTDTSMERLDSMSIGEFYKNRNVLVTGGTGFFGKILIEKLLRSCEDIGTVYVVIRPKKGRAVEERLQELLSQDVFKRLHEERPAARNKIVAIEGDLADPQFSLNERDRAVLENVISVVFHSAAIIKFDEEMKSAVKMNLGGTKHMIDLAKKMKNLQAFVYISTAYSNSERRVIEEKYYPPQAPKAFWQDLLLAAQKMDEKELNALTPRIIGNLPNNYTFTKQISESLVYDHKDVIPVVIYRPSIVTSAFYEPYPGWIDNLNGPVGMVLGYKTGILRMILAEENKKQDYVGVDMSVNGVIAAAWQRSQFPAGECAVYNSATGKYCPTLKQLLVHLEKLRSKIPTEITVWKPRLSATTSQFLFQINFLIFAVLPALLVDVVLQLMGVKFSAVKACRKVCTVSKVLTFFTITTFDIKNENFLGLYHKMSPDDRKIFNIDVEEVNRRSEELTEVIMNGIKKYILKDDMSEERLEKLRLRMKYYDAADIAVRIIFFAFMANIILKWIGRYLFSYFN